MNRIILIGNGFDLAHGLKTRYTDFIDDYWKTIGEKIRKEITNSNSTFKTAEFEIENFNAFNDPIENFTDFEKISVSRGWHLTFKNKFLKKISKESDSKSWVDIEEEYYNQLRLISKIAIEDIEKAKPLIEKLNNDFKRVKELLIDYLTKNTNYTEIDFEKKIIESIYSHFLIKDLNENGLTQILNIVSEDIKAFNNHKIQDSKKNKKIKDLLTNFPEEISDKEELKKLIFRDDVFPRFNYFIFPNQTLFLNFNYTHTDYKYYDNNQYYINRDQNTATESIYIHGNLKKSEHNPIIFGYGDELDDDYKTIEKLKDNRYLDHIKSIEYLRTDNYKKLLSFIESDCYQIFIMGHSCGLSDRTLLNTLFEHDNCVSIKPFFYEYYENEKNEAGVEVEVKKDNYIELVQNISRNFNDKVKMRDRVVNRTDCTTLT